MAVRAKSANADPSAQLSIPEDLPKEKGDIMLLADVKNALEGLPQDDSPWSLLSGRVFRGGLYAVSDTSLRITALPAMLEVKREDVLDYKLEEEAGHACATIRVKPLATVLVTLALPAADVQTVLNSFRAHYFAPQRGQRRGTHREVAGSCPGPRAKGDNALPGG